MIVFMIENWICELIMYMGGMCENSKS